MYGSQCLIGLSISPPSLPGSPATDASSPRLTMGRLNTVLVQHASPVAQKTHKQTRFGKYLFLMAIYACQSSSDGPQPPVLPSIRSPIFSPNLACHEVPSCGPVHIRPTPVAFSSPEVSLKPSRRSRTRIGMRSVASTPANLADRILWLGPVQMPILPVHQNDRISKRTLKCLAGMTKPRLSPCSTTGRHLTSRTVQTTIDQCGAYLALRRRMRTTRYSNWSKSSEHPWRRKVPR